MILGADQVLALKDDHAFTKLVSCNHVILVPTFNADIELLHAYCAYFYGPLIAERLPFPLLCTEKCFINKYISSPRRGDMCFILTLPSDNPRINI